MKKAMYFFFLLLANIALLAHVAIPHHHHHLEPTAMCTALHEQKNTTHSEENTNENNGFEDCLISHIYTRVNSEKQAFHSLNIKFQPVLFELFLCSDYSATPIIASAGLLFRLIPYIPFSSTEFIACSIGLRAPPMG